MKKRVDLMIDRHFHILTIASNPGDRVDVCEVVKISFSLAFSLFSHCLKKSSKCSARLRERVEESGLDGGIKLDNNCRENNEEMLIGLENGNQISI